MLILSLRRTIPTRFLSDTEKGPQLKHLHPSTERLEEIGVFLEYKNKIRTC